MARLTLAPAVLAVALGGTALVLQLTERDVSERVFFTHREVQGHETDPEDDPRRPWTLEAIAVCLRD